MEEQHIATREEFEPASEWTPTTLRAQVQAETEMRSVIIEYMRKNMVEGHHYQIDLFPGQKKPNLAKEGALNLCSLFKVTPVPDKPEIMKLDNGHYSVVFKVQLHNRAHEVKAIGYGECRSTESRYFYRWVFENELLPGTDKESLHKSERESRGGKPYTKYRIEVEHPESLNTIIKMAEKRAIVDAALKLPLVSELFTQDLEDLQRYSKENGEKGKPKDPQKKWSWFWSEAKKRGHSKEAVHAAAGTKSLKQYKGDLTELLKKLDATKAKDDPGQEQKPPEDDTPDKELLADIKRLGEKAVTMCSKLGISAETIIARIDAGVGVKRDEQDVLKFISHEQAVAYRDRLVMWLDEQEETQG